MHGYGTPIWKSTKGLRSVSVHANAAEEAQETGNRAEKDKEKDHRLDTEPPTEYLQRDCVPRHTRLPPPENNDERKRYGTLCDTDRACVPHPPIQRKKLHGY